VGPDPERLVVFGAGEEQAGTTLVACPSRCMRGRPPGAHGALRARSGLLLPVPGLGPPWPPWALGWRGGPRAASRASAGLRSEPGSVAVPRACEGRVAPYTRIAMPRASASVARLLVLLLAVDSASAQHGWFPTLHGKMPY